MKRTQGTQDRYDLAKKTGATILETNEAGDKCFNLENARVLRSWEYWVIIPNSFPYDQIAKKHDMLVPKRRFAYIRDATDEERHEYYAIKKELDRASEYESIMENFSHSRSARGHFHAHLISWR